MLTVEQIQTHLERLTYRPGWQIRAYDGRWEGPHIVIRADLDDSTSPGSTVTVDIHSMLPPIPDKDYLESWLAWRLKRIEVHEMREWLKRDGVAIFDPHAPGAEHDGR